MVCECPITITNKKLSYHSGYDKPMLVVPCSSCESCRENIKNSWIIRTYFHWKKFYDANGKVLFVTLSYCSRSLPYVNDGGFKFACFSYKDIKRWLNSIRKYFEIHYGITGIDYIVTCEYGGNGTKRPHYHVLLFFPPSKNLPGVPMLKKIIEYYWLGSRRVFDKKKKKFVFTAPDGVKTTGRKVKRMGYVYWSKDYGAEVTCAKAAKYVGKYICKDLDFYDKPDIKKYLSIDGNREKIKDKLPRHWQSKSFGLSMLDYILSKSYNEQLDFLELGVPIESETFRYSCPLYIRNLLKFEKETKKVCINGVEHIQRVLSKRGLGYEMELISRRFDSELDNVRTLLSPVGLYKLLPTKDILKRWCFSNRIFGVSNYAQLSNYLVDTFIKPYKFEDFVAYKLVYRGFAYEYSLFKSCKPNPEFLTGVAKDIYKNRLIFNFENDDITLDSQSLIERDNNNLLINCIEGYKEFEDLCLLIEQLRSLSSERKITAIREEEKDFNNTRKMFIHYAEE